MMIKCITPIVLLISIYALAQPNLSRPKASISQRKLKQPWAYSIGILFHVLESLSNEATSDSIIKQ